MLRGDQLRGEQAVHTRWEGMHPAQRAVGAECRRADRERGPDEDTIRLGGKLGEPLGRVGDLDAHPRVRVNQAVQILLAGNCPDRRRKTDEDETISRVHSLLLTARLSSRDDQARDVPLTTSTFG